MVIVLLKFALDKRDKILRAVEIMIHGRKSYVRDLIDITEAVENVLSDALGGDPLLVGCPFVLKLVDRLLDLTMLDIALVKRHEDGPLYLRAIVELLFPIGLRHEEIDKFEALKRRETRFALLAFATPADRLTILGHPRIDYFRVEILTFGAAHSTIRC